MSRSHKNHLSLLIRRHGNRCHYCDNKCNRDSGHPKEATKEHVVPRAFGGANSMDNYVLACASCNNDRGTTLFFCQCEEYCQPRIEEALNNQLFVDQIFYGIISHNKPRVHSQNNQWMVRVRHGRRAFNSWAEAMDFALSDSFVKER